MEYFKKIIIAKNETILANTIKQFRLGNIFKKHTHRKPVFCDYTIEFKDTGIIEMKGLMIPNSSFFVHRIGFLETSSSSKYSIQLSGKTNDVAIYTLKKKVFSFISTDSSLSWDMTLLDKVEKILVSNKHLPVFDLKFYISLHNHKKKIEISDNIIHTGPKESLIEFTQDVPDLAIIMHNLNGITWNNTPGNSATPCTNC